MQDALTLDAPRGGRRSRLRSLARACAPTRAELALALTSAALLTLSFPDFNLYPLAWVALVPLMLAVMRRRRVGPAFALGWMTGTLFFYTSCYWLTHAMIHYGGLPRALAYVLLVPATVATGLFPAAWAAALARTSARRGAGAALAVAPMAWAALEWARLSITGQLWNALGYSQAYEPALIQTARWGGVYAVGFLAAAFSAAVAYALLRRSGRGLLASAAAACAVVAVVILSNVTRAPEAESPPVAVVVGVQPNVSANLGRSRAETDELVARHLTLSADALRAWDAARGLGGDGPASQPSTDGGAAPATPPPSSGDTLARVVVWPESPMNFRYARDAAFRQLVSEFARANRSAVLFNSLEPAPADGAYNSAVLVDAGGRMAAQYDKIRLLPFGEYVPLPRWLPAAWVLSGVVGDFTPGEDYPLMPLGGGARAGVFICFESAFPEIARAFAQQGADVLVNISNDGYLGRTPVMRQHLANVVLRAVENGRTVLRVTNTGISARVTPRGEVLDATEGFTPAVRTWATARAAGGQTFYTRYGDIFVWLCAAASALALLTTFGSRGSRENNA
ncbi:MAG TPA: apolipoprotein N-acyltransferase [Pyrinomonadaceae bacterium]|nr:apolipoprotein N-acyltransferase [Pyrinomonadaceae bacterium]